MVRPKVFSGYQTTAGLSVDGTIYMNGANYSCQQNIPWDNNPHATSAIGSGFVNMFFGDGQHGLALDSAGQVIHWGENWDGQAGSGFYTGEDALPGFTTVPVAPSKIIAAGDYSCGCVTNDNNIYVWGYGWDIPVRKEDPNWGPQPEPAYTPTFLIGFPSNNVIALDVSGSNGAFVTDDGKLWVWGGNQNDAAYYRPDNTFWGVGQHPGVDNVLGVSVGYDSCACWTNDGKVYAWGYRYGAFPAIAQVNFPEKIIQVSCEWDEYYALGQSGTIYYWNGGATSGSATGYPLSTWISYNYGDEKLCYLKKDGYVGYASITNYFNETSPMFLGAWDLGGIDTGDIDIGDIDFGVPDFNGPGIDINTNYGQDQRLIITRSSQSAIALSPKSDKMIGKNVFPKVYIYSDPQGTNLLSSFDSKLDRSKFQYSTNGTKWLDMQSSGIPINTGMETIKVILSAGPKQRVFVKVKLRI